MDPKDTISSFLRDATGGHAGGRHKLTLEKKSFIPTETMKALREQWNGAGRDQARVFLRLTEADGTNAHHVTGWDGRDTFVCFMESGLSYVPYRKLHEMKIDEKWDSKTRLATLRAPVLRGSMERGDVHALLDRVRKTLIKSGKDRRPNRFKNMAKHFESDETPDTKAMPKLGPDGKMDFEPAPKPNKEIPEDPPGRNKKSSKKEEGVSYDWRNLDESGRVKRRGLNHPMMKGKDVAIKKGANGETNQNVTTRSEDTDPQLDKRNEVKLNSEGGKPSGAPAGCGGKTVPQLDKRNQVDLRHEDKGCKKCAGTKDYAGQTVKCAECAKRAKVEVRTEDKDSKLGSFKDRFGGKKAPPFGAKKPLVMFVLMKKSKGGKQAKTKKSISEGYGSLDGPVNPSRQRVVGMSCGKKTGPENGPMTHVNQCDSCKARRKETGGGLKINVKKESSYETLSRSTLRLVESGSKFFKNSEHAAKYNQKFLDNIEKMKAGKLGRRGKKAS